MIVIYRIIEELSGKFKNDIERFTYDMCIFVMFIAYASTLKSIIFAVATYFLETGYLVHIYV